ncbi:hypothetical protein ABB37_09764 [Leptomonas pyrrhocoris]|uniref:Transmembrane protein n=1 Tax=Leptomonas pyrrhocoris TaxID=157538 RepID=A0A0N1J478_LEPPY|nr:hypothetical protein ABB37_09764 [Leptomonas pyrrhocoris]KPA73632.1 hypothetical protein ABB37_09764 [Leptomonas pyrrhocoris]|eukprot:XP_015652071.1 hypothetical protein ABB37_09764 [Leptomonas pyrrhocoris]
MDHVRRQSTEVFVQHRRARKETCERAFTASSSMLACLIVCVFTVMEATTSIDIKLTTLLDVNAFFSNCYYYYFVVDVAEEEESEANEGTSQRDALTILSTSPFEVSLPVSVCSTALVATTASVSYHFSPPFQFSFFHFSTTTTIIIIVSTSSHRRVFFTRGRWTL